MRGNLPDRATKLCNLATRGGGDAATRAAVARLSYRWAPDAPSRRRPRLPARRARRAACGRSRPHEHGRRLRRAARASASRARSPRPPTDLGFPAFATKNTTRIGGADPIANAAGVARAVFPATTPENRPDAVALIDARDWHAGIAGVGPRLDAGPRRRSCSPTGPTCRGASRDALAALQPLGAKAAGGAQVVRVGDVARPPGVRTTDIAGRDPFALARALDAFQTAARGKSSDRVARRLGRRPRLRHAGRRVGGQGRRPRPLRAPRQRAPGDEGRAAGPRPAAHLRPRAAGDGQRRTSRASSRSSGTVKRLGAANPIDNAIAFARYSDPTFGWGVVDPGHGLVFARSDRPLDAAAAVAALGQRLLRPAAAARHRPPGSTAPWASTCSTSSPATPAIPCAASTITAGSWETIAPSRWRRRPASTPSWRSRRPRPARRRPAARERSREPHPQGPRPRGHGRRRPPADGRVHAALRAADPQPHRAADRAGCPRTTRPASRASARSRACEKLGLRSASSAALPTRTASSRCPRWTTTRPSAPVAPGDRIAARNGIMRARVARPRGHRPGRGGACLSRAHAVGSAGAGRVQPALVVDARRR